VKVWGLVPARGGSKSIPNKNLVRLAGRPLLDYCVRAAQGCDRLERIFCSTDSTEIASRAAYLGIEVVERPGRLASDSARVDDVAQEFLESFDQSELPEVVVLLQPTSPFVLPEHIKTLIEEFVEKPDAASIHNVVQVAHNVHAWNQRILDAAGKVKFLFELERRHSRNKQEKIRLHVFGNLIAARTSALLNGNGFYAEPVYAIDIQSPWNFDLDCAADLIVAEALISTKRVLLPHLA
jgi:CMP-N-acetylneuraminic acid synthetase